MTHLVIKYIIESGHTFVVCGVYEKELCVRQCDGLLFSYLLCCFLIKRGSCWPAELLKFIPLCILQYPPFFLPSKQQATRHLG